MDVHQAVVSRRSIRVFKDTPVPYDILEKCVDAARLAPSAKNLQVCDYIVVDDEKLLPQVLDTVGSWSGVPRPEGGWSLEHPPKAYIIILINSQLETELGGNSRWTNYDVGIAAENIMLIAQEEGLGSCAIASFQRERLKQVLNIPDKYEITLGMMLGFPDESPVMEETTGSVERWTDDQGVLHIPKRKLEDITHRNRFQ